MENATQCQGVHKYNMELVQHTADINGLIDSNEHSAVKMPPFGSTSLMSSSPYLDRDYFYWL